MSAYPEAPQAARRLWRELAGSADALAPSTRTVVRGARGICPPGWVGVVRLGSAVLVEAGDADEQDLRRVLELEDPSDPEQVSRSVRPAETLGPGQLAYLPEGGDVAAPDGHADIEEIDVGALRSWLASLPADDVAESSVDGMGRVLVLRRDDRIAGAAGHLDWPAGVAHLGIVVDPGSRGCGNGILLGAAATRRAMAVGRYPQWRAAAWNPASRATATRIGYREFGRQFSFRVA